MIRSVLMATFFAVTSGVVAQQPKPLFTEDFESGALNPAVWTRQVTGDNVVTVQSEKVAHGKFALLVRCPVPAQRTFAFIVAHNLPSELRQHHFGRAYMFITSGIPDRHTIFVTAGTAGFPKYRYEEVAEAHGRFQLTFVDQIDGGEDYHAGPVLPLDRWFLLEWEFNDHPNTAAIWVDGEKIFDTPFTFKTAAASTDLVGGFTDLAVGFRLWGAAPAAFDIYYDDIALDTRRIGPVK